MYIFGKILLFFFILLLVAIAWFTLAIGIPLARESGAFADEWEWEAFYEKKASLLFEGQTLKLSNGGVQRVREGSSTLVTGSAKSWQDHSPPLFHVFDDGRVLFVVPTRIHLPLRERQTSEPSDWNQKSDRAHIYLLDDAREPTNGKVWILHPGEVIPDSEIQLIEVKSRTIQEDKRVWANSSVPWLSGYEAYVQSLEDGWGYTNASNSFDDVLVAYYFEMETGRNYCPVNRSAGMVWMCPNVDLDAIQQDSDTGLANLDKLLDSFVSQPRRKPLPAKVYTAAKVESNCLDGNELHFRAKPQPFELVSVDNKIACDFGEGRFSNDHLYVGKHSILQDNQGEGICAGLGCLSDDNLLAATIRVRSLSPRDFYTVFTTSDGGLVPSKYFPIYSGETSPP